MKKINKYICIIMTLVVLISIFGYIQKNNKCDAGDYDVVSKPYLRNLIELKLTKFVENTDEDENLFKNKKQRNTAPYSKFGKNIDDERNNFVDFLNENSYPNKSKFANLEGTAFVIFIMDGITLKDLKSNPEKYSTPQQVIDYIKTKNKEVFNNNMESVGRYYNAITTNVDNGDIYDFEGDILYGSALSFSTYFDNHIDLIRDDTSSNSLNTYYTDKNGKFGYLYTVLPEDIKKNRYMWIVEYPEKNKEDSKSKYIKRDNILPIYFDFLDKNLEKKKVRNFFKRMHSVMKESIEGGGSEDKDIYIGYVYAKNILPQNKVEKYINLKKTLENKNKNSLYLENADNKELLSKQIALDNLDYLNWSIFLMLDKDIIRNNYNSNENNNNSNTDNKSANNIIITDLLDYRMDLSNKDKTSISTYGKIDPKKVDVDLDVYLYDGNNYSLVDKNLYTIDYSNVDGMTDNNSDTTENNSDTTENNSDTPDNQSYNKFKKIEVNIDSEKLLSSIKDKGLKILKFKVDIGTVDSKKGIKVDIGTVDSKKDKFYKDEFYKNNFRVNDCSVNIGNIKIMNDIPPVVYNTSLKFFKRDDKDHKGLEGAKFILCRKITKHDESNNTESWEYQNENNEFTRLAKDKATFYFNENGEVEDKDNTGLIKPKIYTSDEEGNVTIDNIANYSSPSSLPKFDTGIASSNEDSSTDNMPPYLKNKTDNLITYKTSPITGKNDIGTTYDIEYYVKEVKPPKGYLISYVENTTLNSIINSFKDNEFNVNPESSDISIDKIYISDYNSGIKFLYDSYVSKMKNFLKYGTNEKVDLAPPGVEVIDPNSKSLVIINSEATIPMVGSKGLVIVSILGFGLVLIAIFGFVKKKEIEIKKNKK